MPDDRATAANLLLEEWPAPYGAPPFDRIDAADFLPALHIGIEQQRAEIAAITGDPAPADFANSLAALERAGAALSRVRRLFSTLSSAQSDAAIQAIEADVSALP